MPSTENDARPISCTVRLSASAVPSRTSFDIRVFVDSDPRRDLRGLTLHLLDDRGAVVQHLAVTSFDGQTNATDDVAIVAPTSPGPKAWTVVAPAQTLEGVAIREVRVPASFVVTPHPIRANAWGLPAAPLAGSLVTASVGAKGASDAALAGRAFEIRDEDGSPVVAGRFGEERVAGSAGLYAAEVALPTPAEPGIVRWRLAVPGFDEPLPHEAVQHDFSVRTVAQPDRAVTVTAIDFTTRRPIAGAHVVLHPFRGIADAAGVATVLVTAGRHRLFVTAPGYEVRAEDLDVEGDLAFEAEMIVVVEPDAGDQYV